MDYLLFSNENFFYLNNTKYLLLFSDENFVYFTDTLYYYQGIINENGEIFPNPNYKIRVSPTYFFEDFINDLKQNQTLKQKQKQYYLKKIKTDLKQKQKANKLSVTFKSPKISPKKSKSNKFISPPLPRSKNLSRSVSFRLDRKKSLNFKDRYKTSVPVPDLIPVPTRALPLLQKYPTQNKRKSLLPSLPPIPNTSNIRRAPRTPKAPRNTRKYPPPQ